MALFRSKPTSSHPSSTAVPSPLVMTSLAIRSLILSLTLSILVFTLDNITYSTSSPSPSPLRPGLPTSSPTLSLLPPGLRTGGIWALFATGIGGTIDSLLLTGLAIWIQVRGEKGKRNGWVWGTVGFICLVSVVRSVVAVAFGFWDYNSGRDFRIEDVGADGVLSSGVGGVSLQKWNAQVAGYLVDGSKQARLGREMSAARWLAVVVVVLYVVESGLAAGTWLRERKEGRTVGTASEGLTEKS